MYLHIYLWSNFITKNIMKSINPKCSNEDSFKYWILISLHYYDVKSHKERINQLYKYINNYNFESNNYQKFENNNQSISLNVYDENHNLIHKSINNSNKKACIVKINNNRYHALKPNKDKYIQLRELLKEFSEKELYDFIMNKITS